MVFIRKPWYVFHISIKSHCGKTIRTDFPCSRQGAPTCSNPCTGTLSSCGHACLRSCHSGPCDSEPCRSNCKRTRDLCGHQCGYKCHGTLNCTQDKPCQAPVQVSCPCGTRSLKKNCGASVTSQTQRDAIPCDAECERVKRNKTLASALEIEKPQEVVLKTVYEEELMEFAKRELAWVKQIEVTVAHFLGDASTQHYYFPSRYRGRQNSFLVALAPHYHLFAEWVDAHTGKGNVIYRKKSEKVGLPNRLLSEAVTSIDSDSTSVAESPEEPTESQEPQEPQEEVVPINALYFTNMQLGVTSQTLKAMISPLVPMDIVLGIIENPSKPDCAIHFQSQSEMYMNPAKIDGIVKQVLERVEKNWVKEQRLIKEIQGVRITGSNKVVFVGKKEVKAPKRVQVVKEEVVLVSNPFEFLDQEH